MKRSIKTRRLKKPDQKRASKRLVEKREKAPKYQSITKIQNGPEIKAEKLC